MRKHQIKKLNHAKKKTWQSARVDWPGQRDQVGSRVCFPYRWMFRIRVKARDLEVSRTMSMKLWSCSEVLEVCDQAREQVGEGEVSISLR